MKKYCFIVFATIFAALFVSCNTAETVPVMPEDGIVTFEREFTLSALTRGGADANFSFTVTADLEAEKVLGYEIDPALFEYLGITAAEFDEMLRAEMGDFYYDLTADTGSSLTRADDFGNKLTNCREACMDKYTNPDGTKKEGRGRCLTSCYVDRVLTTVEKIGDTLLEAVERLL